MVQSILYIPSIVDGLTSNLKALKVYGRTKELLPWVHLYTPSQKSSTHVTTTTYLPLVDLLALPITANWIVARFAGVLTPLFQILLVFHFSVVKHLQRFNFSHQGRIDPGHQCLTD